MVQSGPLKSQIGDLMSLKTLTEWMQLFTGPERQFEEAGLFVNVYGEGDNSYLVIEKNIRDMPRTVDQYVLHPREGNGLFQQISFLAESEFDLVRTVDRLEKAEYIADEFNEIARFAQIEVARYELQENMNHGG
jgi:uncharacterized protein YebE (UPF0316 family)